MNQAGIAVRLQDLGGSILGGGNQDITAVVRSTLTGSITFTGIVSSTGQPVAFTLAAGTVAGVYAAPGSGRNGGNVLHYSLANAADVGKVIAIGIPI